MTFQQVVHSIRIGDADGDEQSSLEGRPNELSQNARSVLWSLEKMAKRVFEQGCTLKAVAAAFNVSAKTAAKWVSRYRSAGAAGLLDRSSHPHRLHRPTPSHLIDAVAILHYQRWTGCRIAGHTELSRATVSRIRDLEPTPVV
jgi:hypothetical protein